MKKYIPLLDWISNYKKKDISGDLSAGLTVGVMLIPQGMAYSMLAGLPPIYGLYASTIPLILYAIFGTSRQLAVGPVAMVALLVASGVGALAEIGSESFIGLAIMLSLMVGVIQLAMGVFKLGFLVNFLSHPVIAGFTSAAALIIGFSQFKHLLGISIPRGKVHETIYNIYLNFGEINWHTVAVGVGAIAVIIILKRINKRIPSPLVVVVLGILAVWGLGLYEAGVKIVADVPAGAPVFKLPTFSAESFRELLPIALTISLVGFMESFAVAKAIQKKHKDYEISANQELIGLGVANIGGSFFQAFPTTGGFSRTAVNDQAGARTGLASIISAGLVIFTLIFLTDYFYYLPKAVLAAIILVAVYGLIDFKEMKHLWKTDRKDLSMFVITAVATLVLGVEEGIAVGVGVSIIMLLIKVSYPHIAELGLEKKTGRFFNVNRHNSIEVDDETLIVRLDAQLFFANTSFFQDKIQAMEAKRSNLKTVILDCSAVNGMDSSAVHALHDMVHDYHNRGIVFKMASVKGPIRDILKKAGLIEEIGNEHFHLSVEHAVEAVKGNHTATHDEVRLQTNV